MDSSAPTLDEIGIVAGALGTSEFFVEKDWHVVKILALLADERLDGAQLSFSGGTALSKAHLLVRRFSEDIDFRCCLTGEYASKTAMRRARRRVYHHVEDVLADAGYQVAGRSVGNAHRFCQLQLSYPTVLNDGASEGLRPHVQLEISFHPPRLPVGCLPVSSFVAAHRQQPAEVEAVPCVDPVETGADKLSALVWRLSAAHLATVDAYQPDLMRHVHDLAVLMPMLLDSPEFVRLVKASIEMDLHRGKLRDCGSVAALNTFIEAVAVRKSMAEDYGAFVVNYVYALEEDRVEFPEARDAVVALCEYVLSG